MAFEQKLEDKITTTQRKLKELSIKMEKLDHDYNKLLKELELTPEQLKNYIENPENFTQPIWEQLQNEKKMLDEKLNLELSRASDPNKTKQAYSEKGTIQQHWLFVR